MKVFFLIIGSIFSVTAFSQVEWKLVKEKNGMKIYMADSEATKFKKIRVMALFEGTFSRLISILNDVNNHENWVYKTRKSELLQRAGPYEVIYYSETSMPWPMNNRDAIIHLHINTDTSSGVMKINAFSMPEYLPRKNGLARIPYSKASWYVVKQNKHLRIDYIFEVDPGGSLPAWLVNMLADTGPYETFTHLSKLLKEPP